AVERELVLRLASLLWRLRRATIMETGLFEIQADQLRDYQKHRLLPPSSPDVVHAVFAREAAHGVSNVEKTMPGQGAEIPVEFARCFLLLANLPNFALDRPSRYEATLSRQVGRILFALDALDRRKPQERRRTFWPAGSRALSQLEGN